MNTKFLLQVSSLEAPRRAGGAAAAARLEPERRSLDLERELRPASDASLDHHHLVDCTWTGYNKRGSRGEDHCTWPGYNRASGSVDECTWPDYNSWKEDHCTRSGYRASGSVDHCTWSGYNRASGSADDCTWKGYSVNGGVDKYSWSREDRSADVKCPCLRVPRWLAERWLCRA
ncbi:hypothetical protein JYU34_019896 [Plutella xylostella]|uniref:Uncharacterized protein n=1 Tax=Plutella xylostella TaxID=51655 RepID=A0ABQ7PVG9_PLUXY|nr:hypothetical protein JYU34_019896 [Plutella xylostella]